MAYSLFSPIYLQAIFLLKEFNPAQYEIAKSQPVTISFNGSSVCCGIESILDEYSMPVPKVKGVEADIVSEIKYLRQEGFKKIYYGNSTLD